MTFQTVFKRYELKYLLTKEQKKRILIKTAPHMSIDQYGRTEIRNIYFDTDNYRLVRRSIERPAYKEKLRIRSYRRAEPDSTVFVELKKKYNNIVYKRRLPLTETDALKWLLGEENCREDTQISKEIDYFLKYYNFPRPSAFLSYEREAYFSDSDLNFRVTFDENILCRLENLSLESEIYGEPLLPENTVLMEIKCSGGIPMWMTRVLSEERIYKTSFSKYGEAYRKIIFPKLSKEAEKDA